MSKVRILLPKSREDIRKEIDKIGASKQGSVIMQSKGQFFWVKLYDVSLRASIFVKQEMLSKGGEAAVAHGVGDFSQDKTDILLMGTLKQYKQLILKLKIQPFGLKAISADIEEALNQYNNHHWMNSSKENILKLGKKAFKLGQRTLVMGILNVTPDSFSDGGRFNKLDNALEQARLMVQQGIDILDIGGESTRPNHQSVSEQEEMERVFPVLEKILKELEVPVSIDTYKASVAEEALKMGAHMLNDIWGLKKDPRLASVAARYEVPLCIMHNRTVHQYQDLMKDIVFDLKESVNLACEAGVKNENIILDPGIGFAKNLSENLEVMNHLEEISALGYPVLLGTSRKSMIGKVLDLPPEARLEGTAATLTLGITRGVDIVRVHDIEYMKRVVDMTDAMVRRKEYC
ncbi:dihydropteroate synthase [Candidatus Contubernalis alkaliaceticus]|uniref:dihydropteroate synthase n=1 Tax=Candidatus Contubernalis alkaliaceticus TaxID=338645 RepID=UPI001F4BE4EF|nr:dihydropteroate synthase [Candidatus Contubernalis alkalaceticus]